MINVNQGLKIPLLSIFQKKIGDFYQIDGIIVKIDLKCEIMVNIRQF
jgi:hypothetical protein